MNVLIIQFSALPSIVPVARINGRRMIDSCDTGIVLDSSSSGGGAGRPLTFNFQLKFQNGSSTPIQSGMDPLFLISKDWFGSNENATLEYGVMNWMGIASPSRNLTIVVNLDGQPNLEAKIVGSSIKKVTYLETLKLSVKLRGGAACDLKRNVHWVQV